MRHSNPPITAWASKIFQILIDGPQARETVIARAAEHVPPGRAIREYLRATRNRQALHPYGPHVGHDEQIRRGSLALAKQSLRMLNVRGSVREYDEHGVRMLALTDAGVERYRFRERFRGSRSS